MTGAPGRLHRTGIVVTALAVAFAALAFTAATTPWPPSRAGATASSLAAATRLGRDPAGAATEERLGSMERRGDGRCVTPLVQEQRSRQQRGAGVGSLTAPWSSREEFSFSANLGRRTEESRIQARQGDGGRAGEAGLAGGSVGVVHAV